MNYDAPDDLVELLENFDDTAANESALLAMKRYTRVPVAPDVECYKCGALVPSYRTRPRTIEVESGRSSGTISIRGGLSNSRSTRSNNARKRRGSGIRYTTGRTYYRKVNVSVCLDCLQLEKDRERLWNKFWLFLFISIVVGTYIWVM